MIELLITIAIGYGLMVVTWLFYLAVMALMPHRHNLHPIAKAHAYVLLGIGLALDALLNLVVGTLLFLDPPREWLLTLRLMRYLRNVHERAWRRDLAEWLCDHLLDQFDPNGTHCGRRGRR
jgi:hypothetical protein